MELVFEDQFNTLDKGVWSLRNRWTKPEDLAQPDWRAVKVRDGKLRLFAIPSPDVPGQFLNGHIGTQGQFEFTYGYVEAMMKFHPYTGSHSALWLQSLEYGVPNNPEIDIAESLGKDNPLGKAGTNILHNVYADTKSAIGFRDSTNDLAFNGKRWWQRFNRFGCLWTPEGYKFFINGKLVSQTDHEASSSPKYICLSMITRKWEVPDFRMDQLSTYRLVVDWVKVWQ